MNQQQINIKELTIEQILGIAGNTAIQIKMLESNLDILIKELQTRETENSAGDTNNKEAKPVVEDKPNNVRETKTY